MRCTRGKLFGWIGHSENNGKWLGREQIFDMSGASVKGMPEIDHSVTGHFVTIKYTEANGERIASSVVSIPRRVAFIYERFY